MKRLLAILGVFALLGTLFVIASASPSTAGNQCDEGTTVTTEKDDCKPDRPDRPRCEGIDKETAKLLKEIDGWSWSDCCIDWDATGVPAWAEQYRCAPEPCQAELGTGTLDYLTETYGDLFDYDDCCIELDQEHLPEADYKYRCEIPEPEPEPTPTPVEVEVEVPVYVPVPIEVPAEPVIVERPVTVVQPAPAFTG